MAGPFTGTWLNSVISEAEYTGALKWGTGINPIHGNAGMGPNIVTNAKIVYQPTSTPGGEDTDSLTPNYAWDSTWNPDPEQPAYNTNDADLFSGYDNATGTSDRPPWNSTQGQSVSPYEALPNPDPSTVALPENRADVQNDTGDNYPSWGGSRKPAPGGNLIRSLRRGSSRTQAAKQLPLEAVNQGWLNKNHGIVADSRPSDDSQIFIQTSQIQRYKQRAGSQNAGSQSTQVAPIDSRVTGQKIKVWTDPNSARHWDMLPYEQQDYARPFLTRQAGTGYREWMYPNELYVSPAIQREPAADPELGPVAGLPIQEISGSGGFNEDTVYDFGMGYY
jgi:hypothetical protein